MPSDQNLLTEEQLEKLEGLAPMETEPILPGKAAPSLPFMSGGGSTVPFFAGSLPPQFQLDSNFSRARVLTDRIPKNALMPFGPQSNPSTNAAAQSTARAVFVQAPTTAPTPAGDLEQVPVTNLTGTSYTVQNNDRGTLLSFNNAAGGAITLPSGSVGGTNQSFVQAKAGDAVSTQNTATFTSNVTSGNTIVAIVLASALDGVTVIPTTSVTDTKGNTYTKLSGDITFFASGGGQLQTMSIWAATGVTGGSVTVQQNVAVSHFLIMTVMEYTPSNLFVFDGTPTNANGAGALTTPTLNASGGADLLLAIVMYQTTNVDQTTSFGAGYTQRNHFFENGLIGYCMVVADRQVSAAGGYTASATLGTQGNLTLAAITNGQAASTGFSPGWFVYIENTGPGVFSVSPASGSGSLIDGSASPVILTPKTGALFAFDGTNWFTMRGIGSNSGGASVKTADYNVATTDSGQLIQMNSASAHTITLLASPPMATWWVVIKNVGTGVLTIARNGLTIDGKSTNLTLGQGDSVAIFTDGSNYQTGIDRIFDLGNFVAGVGTNNQVLLRVIPTRSCTFPAGAPNARATASANATSNTIYTVAKNGVSFATVQFNAGGVTYTWTQAADATFNGTTDVFTITGPATADATLADVGILLQGYRF